MMFNNFYVFIGLDGAGKSSAINELLYLYKNSKSFHFIPKTENNKKSNKVIIKKNLKVPSNKLVIIFSFFRIIKNLIKCWIFIPLDSFRLNYLFGDRYIYGYFTEPIPLKFYLSKRFSLNLISLFPKPNKIFYIEINEEQSKLRKNELNMDQMKVVRSNIENLSKELKNVVKINAEDKNINEVINEIARHIPK